MLTALARPLLALLAAALLLDARGAIAPFAAHGQTFPWPTGPVVEDGPPPGWGAPYVPAAMVPRRRVG